MKIKQLLILVLSLVSLTAFAQGGGIRGKVVSRAGRTAVGNVTVTTAPGGQSATTASDGSFLIENVPVGSCTLTFRAPDFEELQLMVRLDRADVKDINTVILVPSVVTSVIDDSAFSEYDTESANDAQSIPTALSASKDLYTYISSYKFSEMRFNTRGYDSPYTDVYMNGILMNDALTGYSPWSLWSGLNDATRNQETTSGLTPASFGIGGLAGSTNILARASQLRKGLNVSLVNGNSSYRFRGMVTYSTGMQDNGWAFAFSLSTRQGGNSYVDGVYYNAFGYFVSLEKQFARRHRLSLTVLGAPTERGAQQASTQEVYDLVGNNYYNPNWGYQSGKMRNSRVRDSHEPVAMLNYHFDISDRSQFDLAGSFRFGKNGYSALTWFGGPDPRPDYYRYLPSYENCPNPAMLAEQWMANVNDIRYINWDDLYQTNYRQPNSDPVYGVGRRANYMVEDRHTDQRDWNFMAQYGHTFRNSSRFVLGANFRRNRTEYYDQIKDLMGGDYWVDVDKFAERDFGSDIASQNNLAYYEKYGHAQAVKEGDKFNYDYYAHVLNAKAWGSYTFAFGFAPKLVFNMAGEVGYAKMWREGRWMKGLFPENSYGDSKKLDYLTYRGKLNLNYQISAAHGFEANVAYMQNAPLFQTAFVSPRSRNSVTPGVEAEHIFAADAAYNLRLGDFKLRLSGYYTKISDQTKVISFYNDLYGSYGNFAMSGIDQQHFGLEAAVSIPIVAGISLNSAVNYGQYTYTSNPYYVETADNSAETISNGTVYWKDFRVEETPQTAINVGLSYRGSHNWFASVDWNYYDHMYLSMNPLYRTDNVITTNTTAESLKKLRHEEKFDSAYVLNASLGKNWYIHRRYTLGFSLEVKNILNNQDIKTGGYEQMRLNKVKEEGSSVVSSYKPFDSKYFYMFGTTYYMNLYFRF